MANYLFAYHGGRQPTSEAEGAEMMDQWDGWLDGLGDANVDPGNPVGKSYTVSAGGVVDNGGANPIMGFSIIEAANLDAALAIAKTCPFLKMDGTIEVAEMMEM
jgi:hypothetical protein